MRSESGRFQACSFRFFYKRGNAHRRRSYPDFFYFKRRNLENARNPGNEPNRYRFRISAPEYDNRLNGKIIRRGQALRWNRKKRSVRKNGIKGSGPETELGRIADKNFLRHQNARRRLEAFAFRQTAWRASEKSIAEISMTASISKSDRAAASTAGKKFSYPQFSRDGSLLAGCFSSGKKAGTVREPRRLRSKEAARTLPF